MDVPEDESVGFVCECSRADCTERLNVPLYVYQRVRANGRRFIVVPDHQNEEYERVIEHGGNYLIVEKEGTAGRVAERLDPRD